MKSLTQLMNATHNMDLRSVAISYKQAKMDKRSPASDTWLPIHKVMSFYRAFLVLNALYPQERIVPPKEVDEFWHAHILDTKKYADDCEAVFGYFFHHYPFFGMRSQGDALVYEKAIARSRALWLQLTGEDPFALEASAGLCGGGGRISQKYEYEIRPNSFETV